MRKKRILWVNEPHWKGTGYSVYGKEVLSRLNQIENFEIAELACYCSEDELREQNPSWKVYPNKPSKDSPDYETYLNNPSRIFGEQTFNSVCLDFKPDIVIDIRDWWMFEYQQRSPFRDFFHWAIMPTVDSKPQNPQWVNTFASADSVFAYSEFGRDTMLNQCDSINFIDTAPPAAGQIFTPTIDKAAHKDSMGLDSNSIIVGTVMRNQRRKLYPDLFKSFRMFLDKTKDPGVFLYCHKYYPDIGWETPALLDEFGLNNRVLFTYKCTSCKNMEVGFFQDSVSFCNSCKTQSKKLVGINNPVDEEELNKIYNTFDIYVQYANSEGFGMPQLEAAYAGVPVMSINYSAMESVIKNIKGIPLEPLEYSMECETGCYRAIPNNELFVNELISLIYKKDFKQIGSQIAKISRENYNWDKTADVWKKHLDSIPLRDESETWFSPLDIKTPATGMPEEMTDIVDRVDYLFNHVLHKPEWIGGFLWCKILRDCSFGYRVKNSDDDFYFNESHIAAASVHKYDDFSFSQAAQELINFRNQLNEWEILRGKMNEGKF